MDYERLKKTHDRLAARFNQGLVTITTTTTTEGPNPWDPPVIVTTETPVNAVVRGVSEEYVDGSSIVASDLQVQIAAMDGAPEVGDTIKIDGRSVAVLAIKPIPGAGPAVAIRLIVRG
jgi:hypothetical protein